MLGELVLTRGGETLRAIILNAPPVYDPGGPVCAIEEWDGDEKLLADAEREAAKRGAVLARVISLEGDTECEEVLTRRGYKVASEWYAGPTAASADASFDGIRPATVADIPKMLELGEAKRREYETYAPTFWRMASTPKEQLAPFLTSQVESPTNVALAHDGVGGLDGFLIANGDGYIDDYTVSDAKLWPTVGANLLTAAHAELSRRGVKNLLVVCGRGDLPKRAMLTAQNLVNTRNWFVRDLP